MKKAICGILAAILVLLCAACDSAQGDDHNQPVEPSDASQEDVVESPPPQGPLAGVNAENYPRVDGSTANMPLMAALYSTICGVPVETAENYVNASGGTGAVWWNMLYEGADLLLVYEAPEIIKQQLEDEGLDLEILPIGLDGLVFLVNNRNPVDSLTVQQLQGIYTGAITDWEEVGGEPGPITPFQRNEESGSQTLFHKLLMPDLEPMSPPTELVPGSMAGLVDEVAAFDGSGGAIGYSVYYYANLMYQNPDLKLLAVDGVEPSFQSIQSGEYPLVNTFYVVIRTDEPEGSPARLLRDWLLTDEGSALLASQDYIPLA